MELELKFKDDEELNEREVLMSLTVDGTQTVSNIRIRPCDCADLLARVALYSAWADEPKFVTNLFKRNAELERRLLKQESGERKR